MAAQSSVTPSPTAPQSVTTLIAIFDWSAGLLASAPDGMSGRLFTACEKVEVGHNSKRSNRAGRIRKISASHPGFAVSSLAFGTCDLKQHDPISTVRQC